MYTCIHTYRKININILCNTNKKLYLIKNNYLILFTSKYDSALLCLQMTQGLGPKYGAPRRKVSDKIRTAGKIFSKRIVKFKIKN